MIYKLLGLLSDSSSDTLSVVQIILYLVSKKNIFISKYQVKGKKEKKKVVELGAKWIQVSIVIRGGLVGCFEQPFSVFKQHYTYFYIFFHSPVFPKNINNIIRIILPNDHRTPLM